MYFYQKGIKDIFTLLYFLNTENILLLHCIKHDTWRKRRKRKKFNFMTTLFSISLVAWMLYNKILMCHNYLQCQFTKRESLYFSLGCCCILSFVFLFCRFVWSVLYNFFKKFMVFKIFFIFSFFPLFFFLENTDRMEGI